MEKYVDIVKLILIALYFFGTDLKKNNKFQTLLKWIWKKKLNAIKYICQFWIHLHTVITDKCIRMLKKNHNITCMVHWRKEKKYTTDLNKLYKTLHLIYIYI